jgi:hypothetical protein
MRGLRGRRVHDFAVAVASSGENGATVIVDAKSSHADFGRFEARGSLSSREPGFERELKMKRTILRVTTTVSAFLGCAWLLAISASGAEPSPAAARAPVVTKVPMLFFENVGQLAPEVRYAGRRGSLATFFVADGFTVRFESSASTRFGQTFGRSSILRYTFEGADPGAEVLAEDPNAARFHFFKGQDPANWRTHVPTFSTVRYHGIYPGVDVVVRDASGILEYDLVVEPGVDLAQVRIRCEGAERLSLGDDGVLRAETVFGTLEQRQPRTWQVGSDGARHPVDSRFVLLSDDTYGFVAPDRDPQRGAVVDPGLTYSSYLGGTDTEHGCGADVDRLCGLYVTGDTLSVDYPVKAGSFDVTQNGDFDVFVTKIDPTGGHIIYSTFVGGANGDFGHGIAVNDDFEAFISGGTESANFPVTLGAADTSYNGSGDAYLTKLSADGGSLVFSSFLGGSGGEGSLGGQALAIDATGAVFLTGFSGSANFPATAGAFDSSLNGLADVFAAKFAPDGSSMAYATLIGGVEIDIGNAVDIDDQGNLYIVGFAESDDYPTTAGAFETTPNGFSNGIVTKVNSTGGALMFSSFAGGSSEVIRGVGVENDEAFVAGYTFSSILPVTAGAFDTTAGGNGDGFVMRFDVSGSTIQYASYLGGTGVDVINDVDTDVLGNAYYAGTTDSVDFPVTPTAFDTTFNGVRDAFCARASADGSVLEYSSYVGGSGNDVSYALNVHDIGAFYMVGGTLSADFPTTQGAVDETYNGLEDVFIVLMPAGASTCSAAATASSYGTSEVDSQGFAPALAAVTLPTVPSLGLNIALTNAKPNAGVFMIIGTSMANSPFDGGTLLVAPILIKAAGTTDAAGAFQWTLAIVDNPNFCGDELFLQAAVMDRASPSSYQVTLSNGVALTFGN